MTLRSEVPHLDKAQPVISGWHALSRFAVFSVGLPLFVGGGTLWLAAHWVPGRLLVDALMLWGWPAALIVWLVGRLILRWVRRFVTPRGWL